MSPKWPILCRVGYKTLTQSINQYHLRHNTNIQQNLCTQSGVHTPRSSYVILPKFTRLSYTPPNSDFSSWLIVVVLVTNTGDFCFDDVNFPDARTPSVTKFHTKPGVAVVCTSVWDPRMESHCRYLFIMTATVIYSLEHWLVRHSYLVHFSLPYPTGWWVPAFRLDSDNKCSVVVAQVNSQLLGVSLVWGVGLVSDHLVSSLHSFILQLTARPSWHRH